MTVLVTIGGSHSINICIEHASLHLCTANCIYLYEAGVYVLHK